MGCPCTIISSRIGSAESPICARFPFTVTWPLEIRTSAFRREVSPDAAMIFCRRGISN